MDLVVINTNSWYIKTLISLECEIEKNFYTAKEAALLQNVKDYVNNCVWELTDTKKEFIGFIQNVNVDAEEFYDFVQLKNAKLSEINNNVEIIRKKLEKNNENLIGCIQNCEKQKDELCKERFFLESAKESFREKIAFYGAEYQKLASEIIQVAQDMDTTSEQCLNGVNRRGLGIKRLLTAVLTSPLFVSGAPINFRSAQTANENSILSEQYHDLQNTFRDLNAEIEEVYQNLKDISCSLEAIPERITVLSNKNEIFRKVFLFVCDFQVIARTCQFSLKHIISICDTNHAPSANLKKLSKRNKADLAGKITNVIVASLEHFNKITNHALDFQIKVKAIEEAQTGVSTSDEFPFNYWKRNLLADSNSNGKDIISKNADYRWNFEGHWQYGTPVFLHTHYDPDFEDKFDTCYETSCISCTKTLTIDLEDIGMTHIINTYKPTITFSEWVVNRADCGSKYRSVITLLDDSNQVLAVEKTEKIFQQWQLQKWKKIEIKIQSYPSKIRYIRIQSEGRDTQFWEGHYGVKIAGSELKIHLDNIPPINLLNDTNPNGDEVTRYADFRWNFNGPWKYTVPVFLDYYCHPNFENKFEYCFETSYLECKKVLEMDLNKTGISGMMDYFRPTIIFSEWIVNRADCGSKYYSSLELLDKSHRVIAETKDQRRYRRWHLQKWEKMTLQIHVYPPGVRFIRVTSSGKDTQFWEGHYGIKIAGSELLVKLT